MATVTEKSDQGVLDDTAMELYIRRVHAATGMKDYELQTIAEECYRKATIFVNSRIIHNK